MPGQQSVAATVIPMLRQYAQQSGLPDTWVHAVAAIIANESGFNPNLVGDSGHSKGIWQMHDIHNIPDSIRLDPVQSTLYRLNNWGSGPQNLVTAWNTLGGDAAFRANPAAFMQKFQPMAQGSEGYSTQRANDALKVAFDALSGNTTALPGTGFAATQQGGLTPQKAPQTIQARGEITQQLQNQISQTVIAMSQPGISDDDRFNLQTQLSGLVDSAIAIKNLKPDAKFAMPDGTILDIPADMAATFAQQSGLSTQQFIQQLHLTQLTQASETARTAMSLNMQYDMQTRSLGVDMEKAQLDYDLGMRKLGLDSKQFDFNSMLALQNQNLNERKFGLDTQQFGLSQQQQAFNQNIATQQLGMQREEFDWKKNQSQIDAARQDRKDALSTIVDLMGEQVKNKDITAANARNALNAMLEVYKLNPYSSDYMPGAEPGGPLSMQYARAGAIYDSGAHKQRPFPVNLQTMVDMGNQGFSLSDSMKTAQQLLQQTGFLNAQSTSLTGAPGAPSPLTAPLAGGTAPSSSPLSGPASVTGMTGTPAPGAVQPGAPSGPGVSPFGPAPTPVNGGASPQGSPLMAPMAGVAARQGDTIVHGENISQQGSPRGGLYGTGMRGTDLPYNTPGRANQIAEMNNPPGQTPVIPWQQQGPNTPANTPASMNAANGPMLGPGRVEPINPHLDQSAGPQGCPPGFKSIWDGQKWSCQPGQ